MIEKNFKIKMIVTFGMILVLAMLLQSIVVICLELSTSIREDVAWTKQILEREALATIPDMVTGNGRIVTCLNIEPTREPVPDQSQCRFPNHLRTLSQQVKVQKKTIIDFAGAGWNTFWFRSEVALIAIPVLNKTGQVIGSLTAEHSLLPIYSRYEQDTRIALSYLLINAIILGSLGFLRISKLFFNPLDSLIKKAESYCPDEHALFLVSDTSSPFRKLSVSLNTLLDRIERDNRKLRLNVQELEDVNRELKEKNELVIRSEKLASVGRLSAGLAHEIGNPLSIIQGYVELLGRDDLAVHEKVEFSERAQQELDRIKRLIRQLLDFSSPNRLEIEIVSVNSLVRDVISFVSLEKNFAQSSIKMQLLAEDESIVADKDALRQVLINCLFNAADAIAETKETEEREIIINTSLDSNGIMTPLLVLSIKDNGKGIAEDQLQYLFDPFFTTKEVGRGTGLGLFVCHTIMERLAGTITLCNRVPTGVEVRITLPLHKAENIQQ